MAYSPSTIQIAFASDDRYVPHLATVMASILANAAERETFVFYVIDSGILPENREKLNELQKIKPFELRFLTADVRLLSGCPDIPQYTMNTYLRLLLPELLPETDRLLYLDCDMVVTTSLSELWNTPLDGKSLGCSLNNCEIFHIFSSPPGTSERLGLENPAFNAGMMLIDLAKVRREGTFRQTIRWLKENADLVVAADQDGLNVVFNRDYKRLSLRWDILFAPYAFNLDEVIEKYSDSGDVFKNPVGIIHYISSVKPWHVNYYLSVDKYYFRYLKLTPWRDFNVKRTFAQKVNRLIRRSRPFRALQRFVFTRPALAKAASTVYGILFGRRADKTP